MTDRSATRRIQAVVTEDALYSVPSDADEITVTEKYGEMAYIIWYELWKNGIVMSEINSKYVVRVDYFDIPTEPIPF